MIDDRHLAVVVALARYFILNRSQIQRLCFPGDGGGRVTRRHISELVNNGYISRTQVQVVVPGTGSTAPAYYPTRKGIEYAVEATGDESFLATSTRTPNPHHLFHWLAISETHLALDGAIRRQAEVACAGWLSEWDTVNPEESAPEKRFHLYTLVDAKPRLVCAPDAAFLLMVDGHSKAFYVEQDRDTSGVYQVAASKTAGYAAMAERRMHRRHFPQAVLDVFSVLLIAPTERRRDALRKSIAEKPGAPLWRFAAAPDVTPEKFLSEPIWLTCDGERKRLIRPRGGAS